MKTTKKFLGMLFMVCGLMLMMPLSALAANKGYTILSSNTILYKNTRLTTYYGTIFGSDELTIHSISNSYAYVTCPITGGKTKTGYVKLSALFTATSGKTYKAKSKVITYRRPGGASYGYVAAGDSVLVLGKSGSYTQIRYPVSGGYKYAFVTTSDLNSKIIGNTDNYATISNGTYTFTTALKSNMAMDVSGGGSANGTNIALWESNQTGAQKFNVTSLGSGWYKITCAANGKAIDVSGGSSASGTNVQLYEYNGSYAQQWKFYSAGNGYYYIQNRLGNQLDVSGGGTSNGTNIQVWEKNTTNAQKWKLTSTTYTAPVTTTTYYVTTTAGLVLRNRASSSGSKLLTMPYKAAFSVTSVSGGWAYGTYNGKKGYASTTYLSTTKPSDNSGGNNGNSANGYVINGVNIGYKAGSYFTDDGKACTDHSRSGIHSYTNESACNCICRYNGQSLGAVQCFGFARYVQTKLYGVNSYNSPDSFYKMSNAYVKAGSLTASKLKSLITSAKVGAHLRTNGTAHSMIITNITNDGFSIIQCNGSNNKEYSGYYACRIGTYTYTWSSYVKSTYGARGINFIELKK
jgi:hypothetical protein